MGSRGSRWWRDICSLENNNAMHKLRWFSEGIARKIGDGGDTLFWFDDWLPGGALKDKFNRLFLIAELNGATVKDQGWLDEEGV